jgi:CheY-like chemotaxis protein
MRPDTILIDIVMPVMPVVNGIELCRSLKSIPELSSIPVLMITAHAAEEN